MSIIKTPPKIHALIVAAGKGSRFGSDIPKQYLTLGDKTVLEHSILRLNHPSIADMTIVVAKDDRRVHTLKPKFHGVINYAEGGAERVDSVISGVCQIRQKGAKDDDWVLIHDAARACLPRVDLECLLAAISLGLNDAVILATPVVDTLRYADGVTISHTIERQNLWQAQTPQAFRLDKLEKVLNTIQQENLTITDEASGFEMVGMPVKIVQGSRLNMKLTYPEDLPLLGLIVNHLLDDEALP
ncbi:2-C-methyl-D-erythritol 4-phosphate cytidylyltransferase [Moraxella nasovis]|uniref:2-C-methyl-D-erythritol 4-phosphate cytidylyltransferase n=1 Tax=Moraxella nasovis TaxID=2904121 RepID=UPI001F605F25|nr:2-C-methyl-D-erythritol 4-phosphate cytidylyltransferase [Moraxella nasovis]UNU72993.1 2-C-methyl-D-erythritol 4-phosphate cytidylyltransferase [Moraxella nasovis]